MRHRLIHGAGQLRLDRRPAAGGHAVHRGPLVARSPPRCSPTSSATPSTSSTTTTASTASRWSCRASSPTCSSTAPTASPSAWRPRSRRTTSARSATASIRLIDDPDVDRSSELMEHHPRARLPDRRHHLRPAGHPRRLPHRPRQGHAPRPGRHRRGGQAATRSSSREVPYQQTRNRLAEKIGELVKDERIKGISADPRRVAAPATASRSAWSSTSSATPTRTWSSTSSTSSRRCRRRSASSCWPWSTAGRGR